MSLSQKTRVSKLTKGDVKLKQIGKNIPVAVSATELDLPAAKNSAPYPRTFLVSAPIGVSGAQRDGIVEKLKNKEYRDAYVRHTLTHGLAHQIRVNRESRNLTQAELAKKCGKKTNQVTISRLEDPAYGSFTLNSIFNIAAALDVAVVLKLVPYSKFILETADKSEIGLFAKSFTDENLSARQAMLTITLDEINQQHNPYLASSFPQMKSIESHFINKQFLQEKQVSSNAFIASK